MSGGGTMLHDRISRDLQSSAAVHGLLFGKCALMRSAGDQIDMCAATSCASLHTAADLADRCRGEFLEMPGMRLTVRQAQRLWSAGPDDCQAALDALVERGFLRKADDTYCRADSGRACC